MADVVVGEVRRRTAQRVAAASGMERGRDAEFHALRPQRVVVVGGVQPQHVVPAAKPRTVFVAVLHGLGFARNHGAEQRRLEAEFADDVLQFVDRFFGRVRGDHRHRRHSVCVGREVVRAEGVEGAHGASAQLRLLRLHRGAGGIHHAEVEAELVHALVEQLRHHRRGAVADVRHRHRPAAGMGDAPAATFLGAEKERFADGLAQAGEALGHFAASDLGDALLHHRPELQPVRVRVDHRMVELGMDLLRVHRTSLAS